MATFARSDTPSQAARDTKQSDWYTNRFASCRRSRTKYEYDDQGRVIRTFTSTADAPDIAVNDFRYAYDAFGELTSVSVVERNGVGLTTPEVTNYRYDADGKLTQQTAPNGVITPYTYDLTGHVLSLTDYAPDPTTPRTINSMN
jgi:YD repeat-containing protein